jgi:hypothetical protein
LASKKVAAGFHPGEDSMSSHPAFRLARFLGLVIGLVALGSTIALVLLEDSWNENNNPPVDGIHAFVEGSLGTELAPEVAMAVLPELFPDEFRPIDAYLKSQGVEKPSAGDWIDQFGFIRKSLAPEPNDKSPYPVGFVLSYHRPGSGASSPVPFVALSCATCHSTEIRTEVDKPGVVLYGVGNSTMNLLAFSEAFRRIMLKRVNPDDLNSPYVLTAKAIEDKWAEKGRTLTIPEKVMNRLWLAVAQSALADYQRVIDDPFGPPQLFDPQFSPAGPARTQPFRSLVRVHLDRPGMWDKALKMDQGFSKIPVVFHQDHKYHGQWAQFDGSVDDITARSTLASSTTGGNVQNLSLHDISQNVIKAADFTKTLPSIGWKEVFGEKFPINDKLADAGKKVYAENCLRCHGEPLIENGKRYWTWTKEQDGIADPNAPIEKPAKDAKFGDVVRIEDINTDAGRVEFRHKEIVPARVAAEFGQNFRKDHPLGTFTAANLRAPNGYLNAPISGAFLRAPYLHSASILTMAELIGLEKRRDFFYRGRNAYDPVRVGFISPEVKLDAKGLPVSTKPFDQNYYFFFDTRVRGNSNKGHEYPYWAFDAMKPITEEQKEQLKALLEYLKTL